jgi:trehalose 6-phosphate phosphatase
MTGNRLLSPTDIHRFWSMSAIVFDMDGVITDTARSHAEAWEAMFNEYLATRSEETGEELQPFTEADYLRFVDGKPRFDGVSSYLQSRGIALLKGAPDDPPERETVCGLGNRKNKLFLAALQRGGAEAYPSSV